MEIKSWCVWKYKFTHKNYESINCRDFLQIYHAVGLEREPTQSDQYIELLELIVVHNFLSELINSKRSTNTCVIYTIAWKYQY